MRICFLIIFIALSECKFELRLYSYWSKKLISQKDETFAPKWRVRLFQTVVHLSGFYDQNWDEKHDGSIIFKMYIFLEKQKKHVTVYIT